MENKNYIIDFGKNDDYIITDWRIINVNFKASDVEKVLGNWFLFSPLKVFSKSI